MRLPSSAPGTSDATTIEQITDAAEVSETTCFRYFPAKEDVVLDDGYDPVLIEPFQAQPPDVPRVIPGA